MERPSCKYCEVIRTVGLVLMLIINLTTLLYVSNII